MDVVALAKFQFAFTVMYHFFFVPLSIGLGLVTVLFERKYYKSGKPEDRAMSELWIKIFTATFAIGVATGITMEFAFGTNWATYSRFVGDIFGAPLAAEALFAFFLESTFLGVLLFGRNKVSKRFYYVSTWLVWLGSLLSALWIIIANSWMQTPAGYKVVGEGIGSQGGHDQLLRGRVQPVDAAALLPHDQLGADHRRPDVRGHRRVPPAQGRAHGVRSAERLVRPDHRARRLARDAAHRSLPGRVRSSRTQPTKMAAMEGHWETGPMPLGIIGWVDVENGTTRGIEIPGVTSFLASGSFTDAVSRASTTSPPRTCRRSRSIYQTYHWMIIVFGAARPGRRAYLWWLNRTGKLENNTRHAQVPDVGVAASRARHPAGLDDRRDRAPAVDRAGRSCARSTRSRRSCRRTRSASRSRSSSRSTRCSSWAGRVSCSASSRRARVVADSLVRPPRRPREGYTMTREVLGIIWFALVGVLFAGYAVFDGFDLGVGTLYPVPRQVRGGQGSHAHRRSARCGTATRSGCSPAAARCSRRSRRCTPRCSRASTSRSCSCCSR